MLSSIGLLSCCQAYFQKCFYFFNSCKYICGALTFLLVAHLVLWRMWGRCATDIISVAHVTVCATEVLNLCGAHAHAPQKQIISGGITVTTAPCATESQFWCATERLFPSSERMPALRQHTSRASSRTQNHPLDVAIRPMGHVDGS